MISFFLISLPIFAVIGVGWAATRTRLVAQGELDALNAFSFRFALPALLLRIIAASHFVNRLIPSSTPATSHRARSSLCWFSALRASSPRGTSLPPPPTRPRQL